MEVFMKQVACIGIIASLLATLCFGEQTPASQIRDTIKSPASQKTYVLYYFYNRVRCPTCLKFESTVKEILAGDLKGVVGKGILKGAFIDTDNAQDGHYINDYKLVTKAILISELVDGKETRWKNLDKIWTLAGNITALKGYILKEVRAFGGGAL